MPHAQRPRFEVAQHQPRLERRQLGAGIGRDLAIDRGVTISGVLILLAPELLFAVTVSPSFFSSVPCRRDRQRLQRRGAETPKVGAMIVKRAVAPPAAMQQD
ncbi:hypothetical protein NXT3_PC00814 (plasmid) [Sinorhizobium fredii]|uniref:Uncharacterized protein n=1 Tax=Rhizobium fredii TaxID=380 RepID=A0A2L0HEW7_RHIFR|nr:hypothetical protein NXT3_PC00814 [Sinorhizobium fredii]